MSKRPKVLYIDDEELNVQLFELNFSHKYTIIGVLSAMEGLRHLKEDSSIDIVITDMRMPVMDGLEFVKKAYEKYPQKRYYILSGFDMSDEVNDLLQQKIILNYFTKPMNNLEIEHSLADA